MVMLKAKVFLCAFCASLWMGDAHATSAEYSQRLRALPLMRGIMSPGRDMTKDDFDTLRSWGVKLLRYQMVRDWHAENANRDLADFDRWLAGRLNHLESFVLPLARECGMKVAVDLHVPPGGKDGSGEMNMFHESAYAEHFMRCWQQIATRFKGNEAIYGYDLINEPNQVRPAAEDLGCWELQRRTAERIRAIDSETPIIVESNLAASPYAFPERPFLDLTNIIYSVHVYIPIAYTHQRVFADRDRESAKWPDPSRGWERDFCIRERILKPVRDFQLKYDARIYVGEFSAVCWAEGADRYLSDCIELFEEFGWDWSYHSFREWPGWSLEHEGADAEHFVQSLDNPRKRVLLKAFQRKQEE